MRKPSLHVIRVALIVAVSLIPHSAAAQQPTPPTPQPKDTVPATGSVTPTPPGTLPKSPSQISREVAAALRAQPPCVAPQMPCALAPQQKFEIFVHRSYSPYTVLGAIFDAGHSHLIDEKYGPGWKGFGERYGATLADGEFRSFFQTFVFSSAFHQDPRFHRLGEGNAFYRMAYSASRVFVGRLDDGRSAFNTPEMLGTITTSAFSNLYQPDRDRGLPETFGRALSGLGSDAGTMMLREFWPDIKGWFNRHEPEKVKNIEKGVDQKTTPVPHTPHD